MPGGLRVRSWECSLGGTASSIKKLSLGAVFGGVSVLGPVCKVPGLVAGAVIVMPEKCDMNPTQRH